MEEQAEFKRTFKEGKQDLIRGVSSALRFYHNKVQEKERRLEKAEHKAEREENKAFRENLRTPGEKDYEFMLDSGRPLSYHSLDPNTDLDKLKGYLDAERLQYCIRQSNLDDSQEIVFFTKDQEKIKRALEKSLDDTLNKEESPKTDKEIFEENWKKEQRRNTSPENKLGWTPYDDVNHEEFYKDTSRVYQGYESQKRIGSDDYGLPTKPMSEPFIQALPLNSEVSIEKLKTFMSEYNLSVAFKTQADGSTKMYFLLDTSKLPEQKAALKAAFLDLEKHPEKIRKVRPTMKEAMRKAKAKESKLLEIAEKSANKAKEIGQDLGRGLSR
ncbi:hypothetical protein [Lactococcus lactis]|uniref:hypothetical protein n=1 Tax=Lactococcus lactis TaxID=1358 RepID=UPI00288F6A4A|nr:hypothetical protein [Lactococcus lactis]MDT2898512.1 hypothetical protein [Lactococcus lactis]